MTTLEKIRAEIDCYLKNNEFGTEYRNDIKSIIDKYAEQEPTSPCDLCGFNTGEFCGYLGECPAIEKAVSKCHTV